MKLYVGYNNFKSWLSIRRNNSNGKALKTYGFDVGRIEVLLFIKKKQANAKEQ